MKRKYSTMRLSFQTITVISSLVGAVVSAQTNRGEPTLEEIIVTAERRESQLQDVAATVNVLSQMQIERRMLDELDEWSLAVPGLVYSELGAGARGGANITIRGVANAQVFNPLSAIKTTTMYIDDVLIRPVDSNLFDVARIEVLKGPQGTLFGQSAMGGAVRIITNKPELNELSGRFRGSLAGTEGGEESWSGDLMLNVPIVQDKLSVRGVLSTRRAGGWIDMYVTDVDVAKASQEHISNLSRPGNTPEREDVNDLNTWAVRLAATYQPTDNLTITPFYFWQDNEADVDDSYDRQLDLGYVMDGYLETYRAESFEVTAATIEYSLDFADLTYVVGESTRQFQALQDVTTLTAGIVGFNLDGGVPATARLDLATEGIILTHELRLNGLAEFSASTAVNWVVGAVYLEEKSNNPGFHWQSEDWNENADNDNLINHPDGVVQATQGGNTYQNTSVFGDVQFTFGDLGVAVGIRRFDHEFTGSGGRREGAAFGLTEPILTAAGPPFEADGTTPRASISYSFSDETMMYTSYSEGFRTGRAGSENVRARLALPECAGVLELAGLPPSFDGRVDSDIVKNYEIGLKGNWLDNRVRFNGSVYRIDWEGLQSQIESSQLVSTCTQAINANIGDAEVDGFELEADALVGESIAIGGAVAFTDAAVSNAPEGTLFAEGDKVGGTAEWTGSAYFEYSTLLPNNLEGSFRADYYYRGDMLGPNLVDETDPFTQHGDFSIVNLRGTASGEWGTLSVYVNNVFDTVADIGGGPLAGENFTNRVLVKRPRTVGLEYSKELF